MVDYSKESKEKFSKEKNDFFNEKKVHFYSEKNKLLSKKLESDKELQKYSEIIKTFKPDIKAKHPGTFTFYASAEENYANAFYNIINFYPFDGTKEEVLSWHLDSPALDSALIRQFWPGSVGHIQFSSSEYIDFYAGPESITEQEFTGKFKKSETALKISPTKGNTVEFWLKKDLFSPGVQETIFHIGTYPGKVSTDTAEFKISISSAGGGMPFRITYKTKGVGITDLQPTTTSLTPSDVADSLWHHYAFQVSQQGSSIRIKMYVDGSHHSTTIQDISAQLTAASLTSMVSVDSYMAGTIGCNLAESTGNLSCYLDEFRFFKGNRTPEQISKFHDKKIFASDTTEESYDSRLGIKFSFNKENVGLDTKDSIVLDLSGNDVTGRIKNYSSTCRKTTSAIDESSGSSNIEPKEPILDETNNKIIALFDELKNLGQSFDKNNNNTLKKYLPEWTRDTEKNVSSDSEFVRLLQILACELDKVKTSIDSIRKLSTPAYAEAFHLSDPKKKEKAEISVYNECGTETLFIGCAESGIDYELISGNEIDFSERSFENLGLERSKFPLLFSATPEEEVESIVSHIALEKSIYETRNLIYKCLFNTYAFISNRKGTENSYRSILNTLAAGGEVISTNIYGTDTELPISNERLDSKIAELRSISFTENVDSSLFLYSETDQERTFIEGSSEELEFTFEGNFIFPVRKDLTYDLTTSSLFGVHEVTPVNNNLNTTTPDRASIQTSLIKENDIGNNAKFILSSAAGLFDTIETPIIRNVYSDNPWNLAIRVFKESDNKFIENSAETKFKINFSGRCYIGVELLSSFEIEREITKTAFENFYQANKTVYIGAHRENITGTVLTKSDIKVINFTGLTRSLTSEELQSRSRNLEIEDTYDLKKSKNINNSSKASRDLIFRMSPIAINSLQEDNTLKVEDASPSGALEINFYNSLIGSKYNFKSTVFENNLSNVIQAEFLSVSRNIPIQNLYGQDGVAIKENDYNKFDIDTKPNLKILSFEKSMYRAISDEMIKFLGGVTFYNNAIGEPVNKYRKSYKALDNLRTQFFEGVENSNQFERYVQYYRWIDKAVGQFLNQLVPASLLSNTGIENVIESHALERNKYDHKLFKINTKDLFLSTNILSINELLYDWEHGSPETTHENVNCLWQNQRDIKDEAREPIRKVLTTVVTGSKGSINGDHFRGYALRNLVRPYVFSAERQPDLQIGSNRKANKIDLFYKIINTGKDIKLKNSDIYIFKDCKDEIVPQKNKKYMAKTDTTGTSGYLDGDADLLLPFTFYSSSVGVDFSNFKENLIITNNHDDSPSLQGSWVKENVGGMPHRRVRFGIYSADSTGFQKDRPEAYSISASSDVMTIGSPSGQKSIFNRSLAGSPFYNIANIKTQISETSTVVNGNYRRDYEIVQTCGRSLNNTYLVETEGVGLTGANKSSEFVKDMRSVEVPERTRREHIFVNKFSPLGSPEQSGWYGRDRASGEFSTYNTVNQRNKVVRDVYNLLSKERAEKFGYRSGSVTAASVHKTNRNYRYFSGSFGQQKQADNFYVTHQIPQNDFGYSWITASTTDTLYGFLEKNNNHGHQHNFNVSGNLNPDQTLEFLKESHQGTYINASFQRFFSVLVKDYPGASTLGKENFIPIDFAGISSTIYDPLDVDENQIGYPSLEITDTNSNTALVESNYINKSIVDGATEETNYIFGTTTSAHGNPMNEQYGGVHSVLNSIILHRQGPYGWPSWKQIRGAAHPVMRSHRKNNVMSLVFRKPGATFNPSPNVRHYSDQSDEAQRDASHIDDRSVKNYKEIMVTNRFRPSNYSIHLISRRDFDLVHALNEVELLDNRDTQLRYLKSWNYDNFFDSIGIKEDGTRISKEDLPTFSQRFTITNKLSKFANSLMQAEGHYKEKNFFESSDLLKMNLMIDQVEEQVDFPSVLRELNYVEKIYPKEENTFTGQIRTRERFKFFGWKSKREQRDLFLSGNLQYSNYRTDTSSRKLFPKVSPRKIEKSFELSFFDSVDVVDLNHTASSQVKEESFKHISSSTWVLDSRKDYNLPPLNLSASYINDGVAFMENRDQATRNEGILQNDYSIFGLGINYLHGAPPFSPVFNRRFPQPFGSTELLSGEARADAQRRHTIGPFYDTYEEFSKESRLVGQQFSIVPEFTISRFTEDILNQYSFEGMEVGESWEKIQDFLEVTGAIYHTSSEDIQVGSRFYKTYSTSDFLKYFSDFKDNVKDNEFNLKPFRISFRCKAVKRFLPYRGFYPAERAVQLSEIFSRGYNNENSYSYEFRVNNSALGDEEDHIKRLKLKLKNSHAQAAKLLFAPGVLFNSIKSGLAVDYPIFSSSIGDFEDDILRHSINTVGDPIDNWTLLSSSVGAAITGSAINSSVDLGIPRLSGSVSKRVNFHNLLHPGTLFGEIVHDNEPHPSASLFYGSTDHFQMIDRPAVFGTLDLEMARRWNAIDFKRSRPSFEKAMLPFSLAAQNFAANTVDFFLKDQKLQTIMSEPIEPYLSEKKTYKMRVVLSNIETKMYDRHSAFGPPVDDGNPVITSYVNENTTVSGRAAIGQADFYITTAISDYTNNTIKLKDHASLEKIYYFNDGIVPGIAASGTVDISAHNSTPLNLSGETFSLEDNESSSTTKTYKFVEDVSTSGVASTGEISIAGYTTITDMDGQTITLEDNEGSPSTKTYRFIKDASGGAGTASTGYVDFGAMDDGEKSFNNADLNAGTCILENAAGTQTTYRFRTGDYSNKANQRFFFDNNVNLSDWNDAMDGLVVTFDVLDDENATSTTQYSFIFSKTAGTSDPADSEGRYPIQLTSAGFNSNQLNFSDRLENVAGFTTTTSLCTSAYCYVEVHQPHKGDGGNTTVTVSGGTAGSAGAEYWNASNKAASGDRAAGDGDGNYWGDMRAGVDTTDNGEVFSASHPLYAGETYVSTAGTSSPADIATNFAAAVSGDITGVASGDRVNLTQDTAGASGDTTIDLDTIMADAGVIKSSFSGGADGTSGTTYTTGEVLTGAHSGQIAIKISGLTLDQVGSEAETAIEGSTGHNGTIAATYYSGSDKIQVTQDTIGSSGDKTIIVTSGLTKSDFDGGVDSSSTTYSAGDVLSGGEIAIPITGKTLDQIGELAEDAVQHSNGHNGTILADYQVTANVLKVTQATNGSAGDKPISVSTGISKTGFSGGQNAGTLTTGDVDSSGRVIVSTAGSPSMSDLVNGFTTAVASANGHAGTIGTHSQSFSTVTRVFLIQSAVGDSGNNTITGTGAHFGSSGKLEGFVNGANETTGGAGMVLKEKTEVTKNSHGFLPYVPPYLDPWTQPYAEISFKPERTGVHTIPEIIEGSTVSYNNVVDPSGNNGSVNLKNAMNISSAVDLFGHATLLRDNVRYTRMPTSDGIGNRLRETRDPNLDKPRWIIQTRWEAPVLDYRGISASALDLGSDMVEEVSGSPWQTRFQTNYYSLREPSAKNYLTASTGIWHQQGNVHDALRGYYLHVQPVEDTSGAGSVGDLASTLGFTTPLSMDSTSTEAENNTTRKLSQIADEKEICEAVVIIPFYQIKDNGDIELIRLNEEEYEKALIENEFLHTRFTQNLNLRTDPEQIKTIKENHKDFIDNPRSPDGQHSIAYQLRMMDKYILPPHFDFKRNGNIDKHVQYFFQFKGKIKKEELAQLWQNLYPDTGKGIFATHHSNNVVNSELQNKVGISTIDTEFISSYLDVSPILQAKEVASSMEKPYEFINNTIRWLVFKVKYRSETLYHNLKLDSIADGGEIIQRNGISGRNMAYKTQVGDFVPFNWPYDYFSLVEMAEIEAKVDFYSEIESIPERPPQSAGPEPAQTLGSPGTFIEEDNGITRDVVKGIAGTLTQAVPEKGDQITTIGPVAGSASALSVASAASSGKTDSITNQVLHSPGDTVPSPNNVLKVQLDGGFSIKPGSEKIQINGQIMSPGSTEDYVINDGVITFAFAIETNDKVLISYTRE